MDRAGRIVLPKAVREAAGLAPGTVLRIRVTGHRIELEPAPLPVQLERHGKLLVAAPRQVQPPLRATDVRATQAALRRERGPRRA